MAKNRKKSEQVSNSNASTKISELIVVLPVANASTSTDMMKSDAANNGNTNLKLPEKVGEIQSHTVSTGKFKEVNSTSNPLVRERMRLKSGKLLGNDDMLNTHVEIEDVSESAAPIVGGNNVNLVQSHVISQETEIEPKKSQETEIEPKKTQDDGRNDELANKNAPNDGKFEHSLGKSVSAAASWVEITKKNRNLNDNVTKLKLEFEGVTEKSVTLDSEDVYGEEEEAVYLIGLFSGKFPGRDAVASMVNKWSRECKFHFHNSGWIVFEFLCQEDAQTVLREAPYYASNRPLILKQMPRFFNFNKDACSVIPIWIQLPNLPFSCWKEGALNKICTFVGVPVSTDKITTTKVTKSFARCLVEVDIRDELPNMVDVNLPDNGGILHQPILYEDIPSFCTICKKMGHEDSACNSANVGGPTLYVPTAKIDTTNAKRNARKRKTSIAKDVKSTAKTPTDSVQAGTTTDLSLSISNNSVPAVSKNTFELLGPGKIVSWAEDSEKQTGQKDDISLKSKDSLNGVTTSQAGDTRGVPPLDKPK